jgi:hypothetical protein
VGTEKFWDAELQDFVEVASVYYPMYRLKKKAEREKYLKQ